jgi:hypothetical protein
MCDLVVVFDLMKEYLKAVRNSTEKWTLILISSGGLDPGERVLTWESLPISSGWFENAPTPSGNGAPG